MTLRHFQIFLYVHDEGGMIRPFERWKSIMERSSLNGWARSFF